MAAVLVIVLALAATSYAAKPVGIKDCSTSPNKILHFDNLHLTEDPIHIPGNETVDVDVSVLQPIHGHNLQLNATVQKHILFGFVDVYKLSVDVCEVLSGGHYAGQYHCPLEVAEHNPDFNCACPFTPGNYHLNPSTLLIHKLPSLYSWLALGDFHVHAIITDKANNNEEVFCYDAYFSVAPNCPSPPCLDVIGK